MKRSELVSIISEFIDKEIPIESCGSNEEIYKSNIKGWSEKLLDLIENEGMLPPEISTMYYYDLEHVEYAHKWDEE